MQASYTLVNLTSLKLQNSIFLNVAIDSHFITGLFA